MYSDEGLVGEYDAVGTEIRTYGWKPGSIWSTDPLFMKQGAKYYYYHNDHLGTPQKMTSANGAVVWAATYSSFGKATVDAPSTVINNLRFPGQYWDEETGLHYNKHRYFDAKSGRYLRSDPIGLSGEINLYIYVLNNPLRYLDPLGLFEEDVTRMRNYIRQKYPQYYNKNSKIIYKKTRNDQAYTKLSGTIVIPRKYLDNPLICLDQQDLFMHLVHEYQHANDMENVDYVVRSIYALDMYLQVKGFEGWWKGRHQEIYDIAAETEIESHQEICSQ